MPADHELPKRRSGEPTEHDPVDSSESGQSSLNGDDAAELFRSTMSELMRLDGRITDQAAADQDQLAAESDQTLSDSDQTRSDTDQEAAEQNQVQSDSDQQAANRDQHAADRDHEMHDEADAKAQEAFEASQEERAHSTADRKAMSELRSTSMHDRWENASERDRASVLRDRDAALRDRTAELRDQATEEHERALGRTSRPAANSRATAKADRQRAAEDRARAANDRKIAAEDRELARKELERAELDDLTGFYRLGLGKALLQREIDRSRREDGRLVLGFCDVDDLKHVNDEEGHAAGDAVLEGFAEAMRSRLRSYDPVVRIGGDEFVCAFSHTQLDQAKRTLEDVQKAFAEQNPADYSMTFGLAALEPGDSLATLMERSDVALRDAKLAA